MTKRNSRRRFLLARTLYIWCVSFLLFTSILSGQNDASGREHWAFLLPVRPGLPAIRDTGAARTALDRFVEAELEGHGLSLAPEADRATLLRRVSFGLTGLPPTRAQVAAFLADTSPEAHQRMVERYLASPHYGERWGRHWLDAAGYSDSNGYFYADSDRPLAYRYRDYVIRSFNEDKPYDRFAKEQLAGDELVGYEWGGDVTPQMVDVLSATHFLRNAPDGTGESDGNPDEVRIDRLRVLEGTLEIVMSSLLGTTIQCARCHDHKLEPISQKEYYELQTVFSPAYHPEAWLTPKERVVTIATRNEREAHKRQVEKVEGEVRLLRAELEAAAAPLRKELITEKLEALEEALRRRVRAAWETPEKERSAVEKKLLKTHEAIVEPSEDELAEKFPQYDTLRKNLEPRIAAKDKERPRPLPAISILADTQPTPLPLHLKIRGLRHDPGEEMSPGVPAALSTSGDPFTTKRGRRGGASRQGVSTGRRFALAGWIASGENPLFARVMVNRIWQHHFGRGLVSTPENFGRSGARPSHPELLDYLAIEFAESGWSVKAIHRLILNSATYRQRSASQSDAHEAVRDNRLLWHFPTRRLDAESVRDAMLKVSGELDERQGGPYVSTKRRADGQVVVDEAPPRAFRRSVYIRHRRSAVLTFLELFDAPSVSLTNCTLRSVSTVPLQSLAVLNSDFVLARARAFARRLEREVGPLSDVSLSEQRITLAFWLSLARAPRASEKASAERFLEAQRKLYSQGATKIDRETAVWTDFSHMLLATNTFLYVE
jgi:hypothetical protein